MKNTLCGFGIGLILVACGLAAAPLLSLRADVGSVVEAKRQADEVPPATTVYACDEKGRPSKINDGSYPISSDSDRPILAMDSSGNRITYQYENLSALDTSPRKQRERVLKRDDKGRPLVARDRHGWEVHYMRDEHGNVIKKSWVEPADPRRYVVRLYWFDAERRLVAETDIHGRKKLYLHGEGNKLIETMSPKGFIEEKDQLSHLPKRGAQTQVTKMEYDPRNRLRKKADQ